MSSVGDTTGREYWRSVSELADSPDFREFMHREFPAGAAILRLVVWPTDTPATSSASTN